MKRDELKELGLEDDVINKIMALHGKSTEALKTTAEAAETKAANLEKQLDDANSAIEGFKKLDVDGIKAAADDYKAKYEQAQKDAAEQVAQLKFEHALDAALETAKARNPQTVRALLKVDDLKLADDGRIIGLDDQIKAIRETNDFLFESDAPPPPQIVAGGKGHVQPVDSMVAAARKAAGLSTGD
ncbi:MAG TPA: phage scaffolding protein [Wenzhouxiangella sp.]|nr:phage scaffolding protein [Wenzhouxiangella sp.]